MIMYKITDLLEYTLMRKGLFKSELSVIKIVAIIKFIIQVMLKQASLYNTTVDVFF